MIAKATSDRSFPRRWLLRRADQATVAVLVLLALLSTIGWWISQGGWRGRLVELERAEPQPARLQVDPNTSVGPEEVTQQIRPQPARFQVDPNTADWPELMQLPGIGPTLAKRIVQSRQVEGPFGHPSDLVRVRGIGPKTLEAIRPYLRPPPPEQHQEADGKR